MCVGPKSGMARVCMCERIWRYTLQLYLVLKMLTLDTGSNLGCRLQLVACTHRIYVYTYIDSTVLNIYQKEFCDKVYLKK